MNYPLGNHVYLKYLVLRYTVDVPIMAAGQMDYPIGFGNAHKRRAWTRRAPALYYLALVYVKGKECRSARAAVYEARAMADGQRGDGYGLAIGYAFKRAFFSLDVKKKETPLRRLFNAASAARYAGATIHIALVSRNALHALLKVAKNVD